MPNQIYIEILKGALISIALVRSEMERYGEMTESLWNKIDDAEKPLKEAVEEIYNNMD